MLPRSVIGYFRVTLICFAFAFVVGAGTYFWVQHTADRLDRQAVRLQRNNASVLLVNSHLATTNLKLQHTLELVTDNGNRAACSIRQALITARSRTAIGKKAALTPADKAKAQAAIDNYTALINAQRTVPLNFKCDSLLKKPA